jgi:hypothetical protein
MRGQASFRKNPETACSRRLCRSLLLLLFLFGAALIEFVHSVLIVKMGDITPLHQLDIFPVP